MISFQNPLSCAFHCVDGRIVHWKLYTTRQCLFLVFGSCAGSSFHCFPPGLNQSVTATIRPSASLSVHLKKCPPPEIMRFRIRLMRKLNSSWGFSGLILESGRRCGWVHRLGRRARSSWSRLQPWRCTKERFWSSAFYIEKKADDKTYVRSMWRECKAKLMEGII